jgi:hypothetical protein
MAASSSGRALASASAEDAITDTTSAATTVAADESARLGFGRTVPLFEEEP